MKKITLSIVFIVCHYFVGNAQWLAISSAGYLGKFDAIHFIDAQHGYISGSAQRVTADGGNTWTSTSAQGFRDFGFFNNVNGYGAGIVSQSMAKTSNGGVSWTSITPPTSNSLWAVSATSATTAYFVGTGGVLWKTANSGASVSVLSSGTTSLLTDVFFTSASTGFIVVQNGQIRKTTNSGSSWSTVNTISGVLLTEMYFPNATTGYVVGSSGTISKTSNAGTSWTTQVTNSTSYLQGVNFFDANNGIAVGSGGTILHTNNGGTSWNLLNSGTTEDLYDVWMLSATSAIVVGNNGTILKNTNITVGIEDSFDEQNLDLFPNPVVDKLTIQTALDIKSIQVFDALGNSVLSSYPTFSKISKLDFSALRSGIYFVSINTAKGSTIRKVVK